MFTNQASVAYKSNNKSSMSNGQADLLVESKNNSGDFEELTSHFGNSRCTVRVRGDKYISADDLGNAMGSHYTNLFENFMQLRTNKDVVDRVVALNVINTPLSYVIDFDLWIHPDIHHVCLAWASPRYKVHLISFADKYILSSATGNEEFDWIMRGYAATHNSDFPTGTLRTCPDDRYVATDDIAQLRMNEFITDPGNGHFVRLVSDIFDVGILDLYHFKDIEDDHDDTTMYVHPYIVHAFLAWLDPAYMATLSSWAADWISQSGDNEEAYIDAVMDLHKLPYEM